MDNASDMQERKTLESRYRHGWGISPRAYRRKGYLAFQVALLGLTVEILIFLSAYQQKLYVMNTGKVFYFIIFIIFIMISIQGFIFLIKGIKMENEIPTDLIGSYEKTIILSSGRDDIFFLKIAFPNDITEWYALEALLNFELTQGQKLRMSIIPSTGWMIRLEKAHLPQG